MAAECFQLQLRVNQKEAQTRIHMGSTEMEANHPVAGGEEKGGEKGNTLPGRREAHERGSFEV